jgi:hypothetical protein
MDAELRRDQHAHLQLAHETLRHLAGRLLPLDQQPSVEAGESPSASVRWEQFRREQRD